MQLNELKSPKGSRKRRKVVGRGRGSGHGHTSCRGEHGQKSRSTGRATVMGHEGGQMRLIRRLAKVGFTCQTTVDYQLVNVSALNRFDKGSVVTKKLLKESGLISTLRKPFKILGKGDLNVALTVQANQFSKSAKEKIEKAGGKIEEEKSAQSE